MSIKNNKKLILGAISAVVASVATGVLVKNNIAKKTNNSNEEDIIKSKNYNKKEKRSKNIYYTVHLNEIYSPYDDKTMSEDDMIEEIKKETSL
jgi:predicted small secreted protein